MVTLTAVADAMAYLVGGFICGAAAASIAFVYAWNARAEAMRIKAGQRHE